MNRRIRLALRLKPLPLTRDTEPMPTRLPCPLAVRRMTMSRLKPNSSVVSVASMRPSSAATALMSRAS